LVLLIINFYPN